ncbi:MAG TPA: recombination mediator RecR [Opitutales bacterium]|nr:recombination mediator RecR [Opitutales bacterium]
MTGSFDRLQQVLRRLPGLGYRSAERIALFLAVEHPEKAAELSAALGEVAEKISRCQVCGNIADRSDGGEPLCEICLNAGRDTSIVCVVESVPDLLAIEKSGAYRGVFHVLHGRLSPVRGIGPSNLNMASLRERIAAGRVSEVILALGNDVESEATCHYIQEEVVRGLVKISRIGFGLPSGTGIGYADSTTLRSALDSRKGL